MIQINSYSNELFDALNNESLIDVKHAIIDLNINIDATEGGATPLMVAVITKNKDIIQFLISQHADVNKRVKSKGITALSLAIEENNYEIIDLLIKNGADINLKYKMPVKMRCLDYNPATKCFKKSGKEVPCTECGSKTGTPYNDVTILMVACANGYKSIVDLLLKNNVSINEFDETGLTSLHHALLENELEIALNLVNQGVNVNSPNKKDKITPFMLACYLGDEKVVLEMLKHKANINMVDSRGYNSVNYALICENKKIISILKEYISIE